MKAIHGEKHHGWPFMAILVNYNPPLVYIIAINGGWLVGVTQASGAHDFSVPIFWERRDHFWVNGGNQLIIQIRINSLI